VISFSFKRRIKLDSCEYRIPQKAIIDSERILLDFPSGQEPEEKIVFWAGIRKGIYSTITLVIVPDAITSPGSIVVSHEANFSFVKTLSSRAVVQIAQVHTHPTSWVRHSPGDDKLAPFKVKGLLSIVVPSYCKKGMLPLRKCGVHRFDGKNFEHLPTRYVSEHFHILNGEQSELIDLRK